MNTLQHTIARYPHRIARRYSESAALMARVIGSFRLARQEAISISVAVLLLSLTALSLYQVRAFPFSPVQGADTPGMPAAGAAMAPVLSGSSTAAAPHPKPATQEVHIANNGLMLLRGATVLSNENGVIRAGMAWGGIDFSWIVQTDSNTKYFTSKGESSALDAIREGDVVTITGMLVQGGVQPTIEAQYVSR